jgi:hypothetical protein
MEKTQIEPMVVMMHSSIFLKMIDYDAIDIIVVVVVLDRFLIDSDSIDVIIVVVVGFLHFNLGFPPQLFSSWFHPFYALPLFCSASSRP